MSLVVQSHRGTCGGLTSVSFLEVKVFLSNQREYRKDGMLFWVCGLVRSGESLLLPVMLRPQRTQYLELALVPLCDQDSYRVGRLSSEAICSEMSRTNKDPYSRSLIPIGPRELL